jgi:branched-chain amino acid transport system substrate-binding protein
LAALALIAGLAACSSTSKSHSATGSTASTASTAPSGSAGASPTTAGAAGNAATGAPIKVGLVCECSGPFVGGVAVPVADVYKAWVNSVNASGGINGHLIKLEFRDDANNPGNSVAAIQGLISDHVDAIVSVTSNDETWASTVEKANIPVIGVDEVDQPFFTNPDFYPEGETADNENVAYVNEVKTAGAKNFGVVYCLESPQCAESVAQLKVLGQKAGVPLAYSAAIAYNSPSYTAQCLAAQEKHVQAMIIEDNSSTIENVARDCDKQGFDPIYIGGGGSYSTDLEAIPGLKANYWLWYDNLPWFANTPATQAMNAAVDKYYPGLRHSSTLWTGSVSDAWPSGVLLEDAIKAGGLGPSDTPSAAEIVNGLTSLKGDTLNGWYSPLTFAAGKPHPEDCWFTAHVVNGTPQLVNNGQVTCQSG